MIYLKHTQRLDYLLEMIHKGWVSTPKQIAQKFECSDKTARNMINELRELGNEIEYNRALGKYIVKKS